MKEISQYKSARKDAETQRTRKEFFAAIAKNKLHHHKDHKGRKVFLGALCGLRIFANPLRLRVFA